MPAHSQTNYGSNNVHAQSFSCWKNGAYKHHITMWHHENLLCCKREGTIKGEHDWTLGLLLLSSGCLSTKHLGPLTSHRPSTLAVLVFLAEEHIQNEPCYLFIHMHASRFCWRTLVSTTLVIWRQPGRSLPSPSEPSIEWGMDHNPSVVHCKGGINC